MQNHIANLDKMVAVTTRQKGNNMKITDTGMNPENYNYMASLVMEELKHDLVRSILRHKLKEIDAALKANPAFLTSNGTYKADWQYCESLRSLYMTQEEETEYNRRRDTVQECLNLIYQHNRITEMIAKI